LNYLGLVSYKFYAGVDEARTREEEGREEKKGELRSFESRCSPSFFLRRREI